MTDKKDEALKLALEAAEVLETLFKQAEAMHEEVTAGVNVHCQITVADLSKGLYAAAAIREALAEQPAKEKAPQSANCEAPGWIISDHARRNDCTTEQSYPDNFIDALKYDVAKRDSEAQPEQEPVRVPVTDNTYNYAKSLAEAIFKQHFASDEHYASGRIVWGVNDTVIGILTQIDNMVADMVRRPAQHQEPLTGGDERRHIICLCPDCTKPAPSTPLREQQEPSVHAISGRTADELWLETGRLRSELADLKAQQQEPFAYAYTGIKHNGEHHGPHLVWKPAYMDVMSASMGAVAVPLYTAPPASKPWAGLTPEERQACTQSPFTSENYLAIEAKLREKNA